MKCNYLIYYSKNHKNWPRNLLINIQNYKKFYMKKSIHIFRISVLDKNKNKNNNPNINQETKKQN